ncbi:MAG: DUF4860 domain-containing protein [Hungatella sp.]
MLQKTENQKGTISALFVILLFMVFVMSVFFTILIGAKVYENVNVRSERLYAGSVSLGYIANKIRQSDADGMVNLIDVEGTSVLELQQEIEGQRYVTWIYAYEGYVRELFMRPDSGLALADGMPIVAEEGLSMTEEGDMLRVETAGSEGGSILLSMRSGRETYE